MEHLPQVQATELEVFLHEQRNAQLQLGHAAQQLRQVVRSPDTAAQIQVPESKHNSMQQGADLTRAS